MEPSSDTPDTQTDTPTASQLLYLQEHQPLARYAVKDLSQMYEIRQFNLAILARLNRIAQQGHTSARTSTPHLHLPKMVYRRIVVAPMMPTYDGKKKRIKEEKKEEVKVEPPEEDEDEQNGAGEEDGEESGQGRNSGRGSFAKMRGGMMGRSSSWAARNSVVQSKKTGSVDRSNSQRSILKNATTSRKTSDGRITENDGKNKMPLKRTTSTLSSSSRTQAGSGSEPSVRSPTSEVPLLTTTPVEKESKSLLTSETIVEANESFRSSTGSGGSSRERQRSYTKRPSGTNKKPPAGSETLASTSSFLNSSNATAAMPPPDTSSSTTSPRFYEWSNGRLVARNSQSSNVTPPAQPRATTPKRRLPKILPQDAETPDRRRQKEEVAQIMERVQARNVGNIVKQSAVERGVFRPEEVVHVPGPLDKKIVVGNEEDDKLLARRRLREKNKKKGKDMFAFHRPSIAPTPTKRRARTANHLRELLQLRRSTPVRALLGQPDDIPPEETKPEGLYSFKGFLPVVRHRYHIKARTKCCWEVYEYRHLREKWHEAGMQLTHEEHDWHGIKYRGVKVRGWSTFQVTKHVPPSTYLRPKSAVDATKPFPAHLLTKRRPASASGVAVSSNREEKEEEDTKSRKAYWFPSPAPMRRKRGYTEPSSALLPIFALDGHATRSAPGTGRSSPIPEVLEERVQMPNAKWRQSYL